MAKNIYMSNEDIDSVVEELRASLIGMRCCGSVNISKQFVSDNRTATINFTPVAWSKMSALVARYDTEVQWHGKVRRVSDNAFEVFDIIVPPHEVSGTTVVSSYAPYTEWVNSLDDDTFNAIRFHGHSHVNMSVSPSGVDNKYRSDLVTQLPKPTGDMDVFYIFMIVNKSHEWSAEIFDLTNNALYGTNDINIDVQFEDGSLDEFIDEAKKVAVRAYENRAGSYYSYGGSSSSYPTSVTPVYGGKAADHVGSTSKQSSKNTSRQKRNQSNTASNGNSKSYGSYYGSYYDYHDDDGYSGFYRGDY